MNRYGKIVLATIAIMAIGIPSYFYFRSDPVKPAPTAKVTKKSKAKKAKAAAVVKVDCLALRMDKADECCQDLISASGRKTCNRHLDQMIANTLTKK